MVIFANEAKADLNEIGDYIARDDPDRAVSFIDEVIDCCESLEFRPHAYAVVPRFAHLAIRKRTFGSYLIFYRALEAACRSDVAFLQKFGDVLVGERFGGARQVQFTAAKQGQPQQDGFNEHAVEFPGYPTHGGACDESMNVS